MPTLKERVENLEKINGEMREKLEELETIAKTLAESDGLESAQKIIQEAREKIEEAIKEGKTEIARMSGGIPEVLDGICTTLENELGVNLVLLRKKIKEL